MNRIGLAFFFSIFAVTFGGVGIGVFFGLIYPNYRDAEIARSGTELTAYVTDISSNMYVNEIPYYKIHFVYEIDGETKTGATNSAYTYYEAVHIYDAEFFQIKVSSNGRAVAADYQKIPGAGMFWIFVIVFGGVGVGMGIATTFLFISALTYVAINKNGALGRGQFIESRVGMYVNHQARYKVTFNFKDDTGAEHTVKTSSTFTSREVETLELLQEFDIKYKGKRAIIDKINFKKSPQILRAKSNSLDEPVNQPSAWQTQPERTSNQYEQYEQPKPTSTRLYLMILAEIKRKKTVNEAYDVLDIYNKSIDSQTYYRLKDDIERLREKNKLK